MKLKKSATVLDVARAAGVSPGTVSRALADSRRVSAATRTRVLEAAEALRYAPNLAARRLSTGKTLTVAVVVPFFTRPSVSERLYGAASALAGTPYDLIIHNVATPEQRASCFRSFPHRRQADGVLIISLSPTDEEVPRLLGADVPIVLIDADHEALVSIDRIVVDDVAGGRLATGHLLELGHKRIGFIGDHVLNPFHFTSSADRYRGYRQAHAAAGVALCPEYYLEGEHSRAEARRLARSMLSRSEPPSAIFAASDVQAFGVYEAARELALRLPQDLSLIGYDDIDMAEVVGLTTIHQPLFESGRLGMQLLLDLLHAPGTSHTRRLLPTRLEVRSTTARPSAVRRAKPAKGKAG